MSAEVIYEVNLDVDADILDAYRPWLLHHIEQMCALPGFIGAMLEQREDPAPAAGRVAFCVRYRLRDRAALDAYLRDHASAMRADGEARFGGRFDASRRILACVAY